MGRWIETLKKHENAEETHPQNPHKASPNGLIDVAQRPPALPVTVSTGRVTPTRPNPVRAIMERLEGDMEAYAHALQIFGPMSYGQAMHALGWGATRAGCAESDLRAAGRIGFTDLGRAYLLNNEGGGHGG